MLVVVVAVCVCLWVWIEYTSLCFFFFWLHERARLRGCEDHLPHFIGENDSDHRSLTYAFVALFLWLRLRLLLLLMLLFFKHIYFVFVVLFSFNVLLVNAGVFFLISYLFVDCLKEWRESWVDLIFLFWLLVHRAYVFSIVRMYHLANCTGDLWMWRKH